MAYWMKANVAPIGAMVNHMPTNSESDGSLGLIQIRT